MANDVSDDDDEGWDVADGDFDDVDDLYVDDTDNYTKDDEDAFNAFMQKDGKGQGLLSDLISAKIKEQAALRGQDVGMDDDDMPGPPDMGRLVDEKMESVYTDVGKLLSRCVFLFCQCFCFHNSK